MTAKTRTRGEVRVRYDRDSGATFWIRNWRTGKWEREAWLRWDGDIAY